MEIGLALPPEFIDHLAAEVARRVQAQTAPVPYLNVDSAAEFLATTPDAIRAMVKRGDIPVHRTPNGRLLFTAAALTNYVEGRAA